MNVCCGNWRVIEGCEENIVRLGSVVSVGTGVAPIIEMNPLSLALSANPYAAAIAVKTLGMIVMDQAWRDSHPESVSHHSGDRD